MKRAILIFAGFAVSAVLLSAQFGGVINRAKQKVDDATKKAKPVTGRAERAVETYRVWTPEEEQQIGEATAAKMVAMFGVVDSPKLVRYVNLVGQAVAQYAPRQVPYRFEVLDSDIVGAFALPGGFIFITKTALEGINDESQLAGALGHEILHVSERHLEAEIRGRNNSSWAIEEAKAKTANSPEFLRGRADALLKDMFDMRLSREKEDDADERGTLMAAQAGYAASGLLEFLRTLAQVQAKAENQRAFGQLLSTHPPFNDRIAHLNPIVQKAGDGGKTLEARFTAAIR
jgi:predicted Zn-dependent protease